ncbi:MAG: nitroreductase family protein [Pseudomonadota bacterium]
MTFKDAITERFGASALDGPDLLTQMASRGSARHFTGEDVPLGLVQALAATALASPTKSDLQQRDILIVTDPALHQSLADCCGDQEWIAKAPVLLIFLANHRRQRRLSTMHGLPFDNDHADAPFNAAIDAAVAMATFVAAAERIGLGCCPISTIRNEPERVRELLGLPDQVFPAMGLGLGWPKYPPRTSMRLPLSVTLHENRFDDAGEEDAIRAYDRARNAHRPFARQRLVEELGKSADYGWSEDKARQYLHPQRAGWGAWLRRIGLNLT